MHLLSDVKTDTYLFMLLHVYCLTFLFSKLLDQELYSAMSKFCAKISHA